MNADLQWIEGPISRGYLTPRLRAQGCEIPRTKWRCDGRGYRSELDIDGAMFCASACPADKDGHGERRCQWTRAQDMERERALIGWLRRMQHDYTRYYCEQVSIAGRAQEDDAELAEMESAA